MWQYPGTDLDRPDKVLNLLGSFWSRLYEGQDLLRALLRARLHLERQTYTDYQEAALCLDRRTTPLLHRQHWRLLTVRQSARGQITPHYGDTGLTHGGSPRVVYGRPLQQDRPIWEVDPLLMEVPFLQNRLTTARRILVQGSDFRFDAARHTLEFVADPFADEAWLRRPLFGPDGLVQDAELLFWIPQAGVRQDYLQDHWTWLLGVDLPATPQARTAVTAALDAIIGGTVGADSDALLAALTGVALTAGQEVVELVQTDTSHLCVVTDQQTYRFPAAATVTVAVGDAVGAGQGLTDALQILELNRGQIAGLAALTLGAGMLVGAYVGDLTFRNSSVPLEVTTVEGRTRVSFALSGWPLDVTQFWDEVHARGLAQGKTLAQYLDQRPAPTTEPEALHLPATINPLEFLVQNLLATNVWVARLRIAALNPAARLAEVTHVLRRILPPHTALLLVLDLPTLEDSGTMTADEAPTGLTGMVTLQETDVLPQTSGPWTARVVSTLCQ